MLLGFIQQRKLPIVIQSELSECGLACVAMIASYYGYDTDLRCLRRKFGTSLNGNSLYELTTFIEKLNMMSRAIRVDISDLVNVSEPAILHWDMNHFVVLKKANKNKVVIHDPSIGERVCSWEEVSKHFTGIMLEVSPTIDFKPKIETEKLNISSLWTHLSGLGRTLLQVFLISLLLQLFILVSPYFIQLVIDKIVVTHEIDLLNTLAIGFSLILVFEVITRALRNLSLAHVSCSLSVQLATNLFHHLIRLPIDFFEKRHIGDIVSRFSSIYHVKQFLTTGVTEVLVDGVMALLTLTMLFIYSPQLTLVVLLTIFLYVLIRLTLLTPLRSVSEMEIVSKARENTTFMETIKGISPIKLFSAETIRESTWKNQFNDYTNWGLKLSKLKIIFESSNRLTFGLSNILVIYLATLYVFDEKLTAGMLIAFIAYQSQFIEKITNLVEKLIDFKMLDLHFERIADVAFTDKEVLVSKNIKAEQLRGEVELKNVCFKYDGANAHLIEKQNLRVEAGDSIAIVGPSGCGKTSLMKIMLGILSPNKGEVLIDGKSMSEIGISTYRTNVATVMQGDELLSGTILENITFFQDSYSIDEVIYFSKLVSIHNTIEKLPMGYDTYIGGMGSTLSGGQKQRILLARALYKKPKVLFMDEATSHLDANLERDISLALKKLKITRILIAHRKETIETANKVYEWSETKNNYNLKEL